MAIVRFEPFNNLLAAERQMDRLFKVAFTPFFGESELSTRTWAPPVDIYETENDIVLKAELAGVDSKDVEVKVKDNTLNLKGERKFEKEVKNESYHREERSYGSFARSFTLPSSISTDKVKAEFKDGLLTLTLPKREEAKPRTVQIDVSKN